MNIFELSDSIQVNPKWKYDINQHKWTIDENDIIIHNEMTNEIYKDFYKLDCYNIMLEEAITAFNKLSIQLIKNNNILKNDEVNKDHIIISNECLMLNANILGYNKYRTISLETNISNYDNLQLSNEGIKDILKEIIEKIKNVFKYVWNFFKKLFIKLLNWLGLWENKLDNMHKELQPILKNASNEDYYKDMHRLRVDFNNILTRNPLGIKKETLNKIFNIFPIVCLTMYKPNTFKELFESINIKDILRPVTLDLDSTLKLISEGKYKDLNSSKIMANVKDYIDKKIKNENNEVMYITTLNKPIKYLCYNTDKKEIIGYKEFEINLNDLSNPSDYLVKSATISTYDIEQAFKYVQNDFIKHMKDFEKDIKKIHSKLDKLINEIDKNIDNENKEQLEKNKNNLRVIKSFGSDIPNDIINFMYTMVKKYIKILTLIYEDIKEGGTQNLHNFISYVKSNKFPDAELKYIDNNKSMPYIDLGNDFWNDLGFANGIYGGAAFHQRHPAIDEMFGKDNDYTNIIFLDSEWLDGKIDRSNYKNLPKEYFIKLLETRLKELNLSNLNYNNLDSFKVNLKELVTKNVIDDMICEVLYSLSVIINNYDNTTNTFSNIMKFTNKEKKISYYHELGHIIMRQNESIAVMNDLQNFNKLADRYLSSDAELEADAYAMLMTGSSIKEMAKFRCLKLMPELLSTKIDLYMRNLKLTVPKVKPWTKMNTFTKVLNYLKGN